MRGAGIATVQQTLTSEAALVLKRAIADAQRRGHSQVTPLHVASSLLASPASMLQSACIQSHRQAAHPLHCRALELCFNIALDRLPAASSSSIQNSSSIDSGAGNPSNLAISPGNPLNSSSSPSAATLSNALVAALKRAQAHQRRGCPEQHQVPLLAIKVEMEQLVISILDDPSVSRVMREAGYSSTRAKSTLEAATVTRQPSVPAAATMADIDAAFRTRLIDRSSSNLFAKDVDAAIATLSRRRKRNPVLLGDDGAANVVLKELVSRIQIDRKDARIMVVERGFGYSKDATQRCLVEISVAGEEENRGGVVVVMGSLGWCVEQSAMANAVMAELAKVLARAAGKLWLIATATSQCYMRFLAQYPAMENGLDFQPLPISTSHIPSIRPRFSLVEKHEPCFPRLPKMPFKFPDDQLLNLEELHCCADCTAKLEQESFVLLQDHQSKTESVQSSSGEGLPLWIVKGTTGSKVIPQEPVELTRELRKKWSRYCQLMHSKSSPQSLPNLNDSNSSSSQTSSPDGRILQHSRRLELNPKTCLASAKTASSNWLSLSTVTDMKESDISSGPTLSLGLGSSVDKPTSTGWKSKVSKVTTELALGTATRNSDNVLEIHQARLRDTSGCKQNSSLSAEATQPSKRYFELNDPAISFKALYKGLCQKVPWQADAASKIASTVAQCRGGDRRRGANLKRDAWLLLTGPDAMGKRKVAKALSEMLYGEDGFVLMSLNSHRRTGNRRSVWDYEAEKQDGMSRGRTVTDRIADAVKMNPFSLFLLEEFDKADAGVKTALLKCMERGKIQHSSGREISFGNTVTLLTTSSKDEMENAGLEERLAETERREIREVAEEEESNSESSSRTADSDEEHNRTDNETRRTVVSVIELKDGGGKETILSSEKDEEDRSGSKRKSRSRWWERLAGVLDPGRTRNKVGAGLDLNLGLRCSNSSWDCEEGGSGGHFDEVVCFSDFEVESTGEIVMEKVEEIASRYGVCVEIDRRVVEMMMCFVWEEVNGRERFERWMEQWIEGVVARRRRGVVRIVAGDLVEEGDDAIAEKKKILLGRMLK